MCQSHRKERLRELRHNYANLKIAINIQKNVIQISLKIGDLNRKENICLFDWQRKRSLVRILLFVDVAIRVIMNIKGVFTPIDSGNVRLFVFHWWLIGIALEEQNKVERCEGAYSQKRERHGAEMENKRYVRFPVGGVNRIVT
ncbi:hypothetical protein T12_6229 [Trichinella patagoniensis]|uniref:Uncharacterized protein n=1 Tax=Trichinella patagoniensis TaxID=990121 RepID=A0A0V0ZTE2_9BILA|nr:hypothetical protein T12_6229 [Trichinella patagoniensis]